MADDQLAAAWRGMAEDNRVVVMRLFEDRGQRRVHLRSAVSRAYYAAYAKVHARLAESGLTLPSRGNFGHRRLQVVIQDAWARAPGGAPFSRLSGVFNTLYKLRLAADYEPFAGVDESDARAVLGCMTKVFREWKR